MEKKNKKDYLFKKIDRIVFLCIFIFLIISNLVIIFILIFSYFNESMKQDTFIPLLILSLVVLFGFNIELYLILFMQSYVKFNEKSISFYCFRKKYNKTISWLDVKKIEKKDLYFSGRAGGYKPFIVIRTDDFEKSQFYRKDKKLWYYTYIKRSDTILLDFDDEKFKHIFEFMLKE